VHSLTNFLLALSFCAMATPLDSVARQLRSLIRGDVEFDAVSRRLYSTDAGLSQVEPLGIVSPRDTEDVVRLVTYATEKGLALVPRGMGSGLNGGAVGPGIQVDFSRYMHSIIEVAPDASSVRVQPGVVLASLNRSLQPLGAFFPPDPSSENHCSLGGMIGTNASGARTVAYGATKDHVLALQVVMADGDVYEARPLERGSPDLSAFLAGTSSASRAFAAVLPDLMANREKVNARMPRVVKNSCGYRIETLLDGPDPSTTLQKLFVGAEGTLGLVTEATLNLAPLPARRGIAMAYFPSVFASGEAVPGILALLPSAAEIMDSRFLTLVRLNDSRVDAMLPPGADTALLVEFEGSNESELDEKFAVLRRHLDATSALQMVRASSGAEAEYLWRVRKSAVPLMQRAPGRRQPLPFMEDITVHPTRLPECIDFLQKLFDREGVQAVMVGHAGDGNLHTRPLLDPRDPIDQRTMQRLYDEVSAYVLDVGGTLSGEHGDGLVHTPRLSALYGAEIYGLFTRIKQAFDPQGILNPGKKVGPQDNDHALCTEAVRYGPRYRTLPQSPKLHFPSGGYEAEIERCHGCAACKSTVATTMCPTYKATCREHASPRAKANLLRAAISGTLDPRTAYILDATKLVTDYCIECGMCAVECPSHVNIPKLVLEAKSKYKEQRRCSPVDLVLGHAAMVTRLGSAAAPLANRLLRSRLPRRLAQRLVGLERRRPMEPFARHTFQEIVAARGRGYEGGFAEQGQTLQQVTTVAYFHDVFANYYDPELALCVERVLSVHGVRIVLPEQRASGIPEMLHGFADQARKLVAFNLQGALPYVKQGALLVSAEPTASFAFKVHYPDYLASPDCSLVADAARDLGEFLVRLRQDHPDSAPSAAPIQGLPATDRQQTAEHSMRPLRIGYHQPCHLKAQQVGCPSLELLSEIPGLEVIDLNAGCCGMAGTFGMKTRNYDLSIATGRPLFDRVAEAAPDLLVSECSTCRMQLAHATGLEAVHPVTLLAESYKP
jgi:FAD/FMN-containing dehydrogenase/Fe-S oxidoreductase